MSRNGVHFARPISMLKRQCKPIKALPHTGTSSKTHCRLCLKTMDKHFILWHVFTDHIIRVQNPILHNSMIMIPAPGPAGSCDGYTLLRCPICGMVVRENQYVRHFIGGIHNFISIDTGMNTDHFKRLYREYRSSQKSLDAFGKTKLGSNHKVVEIPCTDTYSIDQRCIDNYGESL